MRSPFRRRFSQIVAWLIGESFATGRLLRLWAQQRPYLEGSTSRPSLFPVLNLGHARSRRRMQTITTIGLDIAKSVFQDRQPIPRRLRAPWEEPSTASAADVMSPSCSAAFVTGGEQAVCAHRRCRPFQCIRHPKQARAIWVVPGCEGEREC
jgi:hypothetical protein